MIDKFFQERILVNVKKAMEEGYQDIEITIKNSGWNINRSRKQRTSPKSSKVNK